MIGAGLWPRLGLDPVRAMTDTVDTVEPSVRTDAETLTQAESQGREKTGTLIYVVDDEPMVGEVVEILLQMEGLQPKLFQDPGVAMMDFLGANPRPELLITDFVMGSMNGMELIDNCKQIQPNLKTILFSGNVGEKITASYSVKPDRFVSKPFQPKVLIEVIRSLLKEDARAS
jgi:DNA-binding NtrC family response regulator